MSASRIDRFKRPFTFHMISDFSAVKSALAVTPFDEQFGLLAWPDLERLNRASVMQGALRDAVLVGREVALQVGLQLCDGGESCQRDQVADSSVEMLDHAAGLPLVCG